MEFNNATVYGGGMIGSSWAANFLIKGLGVIIYDVDQGRLDASRINTKAVLDFFARPDVGVISQNDADEMIERTVFTNDVKTAVSDAEFIQESGPENILIKQSMIAAIEEHNSTAVISSSTSGLLVTDIAAGAKHPERIVAGHPYNPVHLIPLVELSKGEFTSEEILGKVVRFYTEIGKVPVVLNKERKGFIGNRIQAAVLREVYDLVDNGVCSLEDADKAVCFGPGLRWGLMGPFIILELADSQTGIHGMFTRYGHVVETNIADLAVWSKFPDGYIDKLDEGVKAAMANREEKHGRTWDGLEDFRNVGLATLLKFHGKL